MITKPMDVLHQHPVRKSKKQKTAFITAVTAYASSLRYSTVVEKGSFGCRNIVIGDAEKADFLITAHYDTPAWMWLPNFITPKCLPLYILYQLFLVAIMVEFGMLAGNIALYMTNLGGLSKTIGWAVGMGLYMLLIFGPANRHNANDNTSGVVTLLEIMQSLPENQRSKVAFVFFDLEEAGLIGSSAYRKAHKASGRQLVVNLDCVGDGDDLYFIPNKAVRGEEGLMATLSRFADTWGKKTLHIHEKGLFFYPSDQMQFPRSMAVAAFRRHRFLGPYLGKIHTRRDNVLDVTNVNILRAAIISLLSVL